MQHEQRTGTHSEDLRPLGHGDWRGLDVLSLKSFLFLHYLRTNITVTYVSQFRQLISYTSDSSILFSAFRTVSSRWEVEGAYFSPPYQALTRAEGPGALLG